MHKHCIGTIIELARFMPKWDPKFIKIFNREWVVSIKIKNIKIV